MSKKLRDLTGQRFGKLVAVSYTPGQDKKRGKWLCQCDCGNTTQVTADNLKSGRTSSCGCYLRQRASETHTTHGHSAHPLFNTWQHMWDRCINPQCEHYKDYGARGITVCPEWESFEQFCADMGERPKGMTLERKKNHLGYGPDNCVWDTCAAQGRNRRSNKLLTLNDETLCITEWAERTGIRRHVIYWRIKHGWTVEDALTVPPQKRTARRRQEL